MPTIKLTEKKVEALPFSDGQEIYFDTRLPGFGVRVGKKAKTYIVQTRVNGKELKTSLGRVGLIDFDAARENADTIIKAAAKGMAPDVARKNSAPVPESVVISLRTVLKEYLAARKDLAQRTRDDYKAVLVRSIPDWLDRPMMEILPAEVQTKHAELGANSPAGADYTFRIVRLLYTYAMEVHETVVTRNPVHRLSIVRAWYKVPRRKTVIKPTQLPEFFEVLRAHPGKLADYLETLLFTGIRSASEIAAIPIRNVDLKDETILLIDTKNGTDLHVPICKSVVTIFERRIKEAQSVGSEYVFYALGSKTGHIGRGGKQMNVVKSWFEETSIASLTPHDLRRTFLTICDELDLSQAVQKRLVGHAISQDVTDGYKVLTIERLRKAVQRIERFILTKGRITSSAKAV